MVPKGTQFEPKGHQNDPKGCQRGAKSEPEIRRHRPVSGVLNKRSQIAKRRLRRLALLTSRGPTFGTFVAHFGVLLNFFSASNSSINFCMPFFQYFCSFGWILALILAPFWHHFAYFWHAFFEHRFCIDSVTFFHDFLDVQNHVFYCKTNSFVHFSLFQKSMIFH